MNFEKHPSKVDWWLAACIWGGCLISLVVVLAVAAKDIPNPALRLLVALAPAIATTLLIFPLYYQVDGDSLVIRCGVWRQRIPARDIIGAEPSRNALSSPAMSLDRVLIRYRRGDKVRSVLVSPRDKVALLTDISVAAPHLRVEGEKLVPRA